MKSAQIRIKDLELFGFHGVYPEEGVRGTQFRVQLVVDIAGDMPGFETDCLEDALNYENILSVVTDIVTKTRCHLIERVCQMIADALLAMRFVECVDVTVEKCVHGLTKTPQWFGVRRIVDKEACANAKSSSALE